MLNEERIRLMTKMASYEEREGKEYMPIKQYYRRDYVSYQMIKTFAASTISFGILCLLWGFYEMNELMEEIGRMDLKEFGISILIKYIVFTVAYQGIALAIYNHRYSKATASMKQYHAKLKKVQKLHDREEKLQPLEEWE